MCGCCSRAVVLISLRNRSPPKRRTEIRMQHLDGDVAIVLEIVREVDRRHAARAELALDAVAVGECRCETRVDGGHVYFIRPYFRIASSIRSTGIAKIRRSFAPVVVSAANNAFVIAASVACAVA